MTCEELLEALNQYVDDGETALTLCEEFAAHLAGCNPCQVVIDNIRQTITLYRAGQPYKMPAEFQERLRVNLEKKWRDTFNDR